MTGFCSRASPVLRGRVLVPLAAGACLLLLAVVLKNILHVPAAQLSSDMVLYIILYTGFIVSFPLAGEETTADPQRTALWIAAIILVTLGIIGISGF